MGLDPCRGSTARHGGRASHGRTASPSHGRHPHRPPHQRPRRLHSQRPPPHASSSTRWRGLGLPPPPAFGSRASRGGVASVRDAQVHPSHRPAARSNPGADESTGTGRRGRNLRTRPGFLCAAFARHRWKAVSQAPADGFPIRPGPNGANARHATCRMGPEPAARPRRFEARPLTPAGAIAARLRRLGAARRRWAARRHAMRVARCAHCAVLQCVRQRSRKPRAPGCPRLHSNLKPGCAAPGRLAGPAARRPPRHASPSHKSRLPRIAMCPPPPLLAGAGARRRTACLHLCAVSRQLRAPRASSAGGLRGAAL
jgi:hypothetical protein